MFARPRDRARSHAARIPSSPCGEGGGGVDRTVGVHRRGSRDRTESPMTGFDPAPTEAPAWTAPPAPRLGIEEEFALVVPRTLEPANAAAAVRERLDEVSLPGSPASRGSSSRTSSSTPPRSATTPGPRRPCCCALGESSPPRPPDSASGSPRAARCCTRRTRRSPPTPPGTAASRPTSAASSTTIRSAACTSTSATTTPSSGSRR